MRLCRGKANELGARKGECGCHDNTAEAFKAVVEAPRVDPVLSTNVALILATDTVDDDAEEAGYGQLRQQRSDA